MSSPIVNSELMYGFYSRMFLIRKTEERFLKLFSDGVLNGTVHTCIGQEACAVGAISALNKEKDVVFSNHRAHGHFIAYCDKVEELIAELMGKKTGICRGIGGSQHLHFGNMYTNGIQGGIVPVAIGAALAEKEKKSDAIVMVFIGDGTMGQGVVYESFNIASLWSLPVVFVLEDNKYAQSTPKEKAHSGVLTTRPASFGIKIYHTTENTIESVYELSNEAVNFTRNKQKPSFIHLETYRFSPHSKGDDFRSKEEIENYKKNDPLLKLRKKLLKENTEEIEFNVIKRIDNAVEWAMQQEELDLTEYLKLYE